MIDLTPFCSTDEYRRYLGQPFSRGEFTYATNGSICIRVPRRPDPLEQADPEKPDVTKMPWDQARDFALLPALSLPPRSTREIKCRDCFDGMEHDCPDCGCVCETCNGTGKVMLDADDNVSADLLGLPFAIRYVRLIAALPDLQIAKTEFADHYGRTLDIIALKFDGGDGFLMPLREPRQEHIAAIARAEGKPE